MTLAERIRQRIRVYERALEETDLAFSVATNRLDDPTVEEELTRLLQLRRTQRLVLGELRDVLGKVEV